MFFSFFLIHQQGGQTGWQQEEPAAPAPAAAPALTQPMMFNPTQFPQPSFPGNASQPNVMKRGYGARRQYPTKR